jgi:hypothetical protein
MDSLTGYLIMVGIVFVPLFSFGLFAAYKVRHPDPTEQTPQ